MSKKMEIEVVPYFVGDDLNILVTCAGVELFEGEQPLSVLFEHFAENIDPNDDDHEALAYNLIFALEEGIRKINAVLAED